MGRKMHVNLLEETVNVVPNHFMEPVVEKDEHGEVGTFGYLYLWRNCSLFIWNVKLQRYFLPGFVEWKSDYNPAPVGLKICNPTWLVT